MIYNGFDFTHPDFKKNSIQRQRFLKSNYDKPLTEDQFVANVMSWPRKDRRNSQTRSPSAARSNYRRLQSKFGFFLERPQIKSRSVPSGSKAK